MLYTTLQLLKKENVCEDGMKTLKASLPKGHRVNALISLDHILANCGIYHALWALRATTVNCDRQARFMTIDFGESTLHIFEELYPEEERPRLALVAAKKFLQGKITAEEMYSAAAAAWAAWAAARAAARAAAGDAAWSAAAWAAAAWAAARAAEWDAARADNEQKKQRKIFLKWIEKENV